MKFIKLSNRLGQLVLSLLSILLMATPSFAAVYNLRAETSTVTMPDGVVIPVWGFALADDEVTVPGPMLEVPPGDTTLTINLMNNLAVPVSIVIPGQASALAPVFDGDRVVSFTGTVAPHGSGSFTWNNMKPGTYIYHSGADPALQVHMGLYGGVKVVPAGGSAYPGIGYDSEVVLFYSEIDPELHYLPARARPLDYDPAYFLVNGKPFPESPAPNPVGADDLMLIRFLNAGLKTHVPALQGGYWTVIAEDGNPYPYPKEQYTVFLPALKTVDVLWTPAGQGTYPVYDRTLHLTNAGVSGGGMLVNLQVGPTSAPADNSAPVVMITEPESGSSFDEGSTVKFAGTANDAEDGDISESISWESSINANIGTGSTFSTDSLSSGAHTITASVTDSGGMTDTATISLTISTSEASNEPPVAVDDTATAVRNRSVTINVVANDTDPDGTIDPASVAIVTNPSKGPAVNNGDGTVTYTPSTPGNDQFTYTVQDDQGATSNVATVSIRISNR
jgi:FtsP/CotA-like multicopper oxidase with cupredoxin domain